MLFAESSADARMDGLIVFMSVYGFKLSKSYSLDVLASFEVPTALLMID